MKGAYKIPSAPFPARKEHHPPASSSGRCARQTHRLAAARPPRRAASGSTACLGATRHPEARQPIGEARSQGPTARARLSPAANATAHGGVLRPAGWAGLSPRASPLGPPKAPRSARLPSASVSSAGPASRAGLLRHAVVACFGVDKEDQPGAQPGLPVPPVSIKAASPVEVIGPEEVVGDDVLAVLSPVHDPEGVPTLSFLCDHHIADVEVCRSPEVFADMAIA